MDDINIGCIVEVVKLNGALLSPYYKYTIGKKGVVKEIDMDGSIGVDLQNVPYGMITWFDHNELKVIN